MSVPSDATASGTGINPWWRYQEENVPGGGHVMVNVGTGNLVLQDDDMSVPHKGIALAFRRTYNSQSLHDVNGDDHGIQATTPGMYGNGWTNTFDAHVVKTGPGIWSVYDVDGARYDYSKTPNDPNSAYAGPPGQHAIFAYDGQCGFTWTKKSGTTYYFYRDSPDAGCPALASIGGYAGRLYQIIGRNRNTYLTFNYSWDNGDASATGKVSAITVQTESGLTANLSFADVAGHRLLQQIVFPDGVTSVSYGYDSPGNLTSVSRPSNNASGIRPAQTFGYISVGNGSVLQWAASPRWCASTCGTDGAFTAFGFSGSSVPALTLSAIALGAVINPVIPDGTGSGALQPGYSTGNYYYAYQYFTTGVATPTYRDTDGHMANWVVDGSGRPTQTQECTASVNQGQQCTGTWLVSNEAWDVNNNLTSTSDPRGYETDYAFDANGNAVAVAQPQTATSQGTFRPTALYDYDAFNNVTAYCDPSETHAAGADWASIPASSDSLCSSHAVAHARFTFAYPAYQPNGELTTMTTPMGYAQHVIYAPAQQGGSDFGLPTAVTGDPFTQVDGTSNTPTQTFWYDGPGNLRCYGKGIGTYVLSYDALGRLTSEADPDDASANASSLCGKNSGQVGWNTQNTYTYYPDGSKAAAQSPADRAAAISTGYAYDLDGNETSEIHHYGCSPGSSCMPGTTIKWYDGADRLVEVAQPQDPSDLYAYPWLTRYIYDLSQGGNVSLATASFKAYGGVYKTQEWLAGPGVSTPSWTDLRGSAFDALDRGIAKYSFSPSADTTPSIATTRYDGSAMTLGLLSSQTDELNETTTITYDELGHQSGISFNGDGGVTPAKAFIYDANGRQVVANGSAYGAQTTRYDADGHVAEVDESTSGGVTSPARLTYDYYPNGDRKDINVASSGLNAAPLMTYSRRADGALTNQGVNYSGATATFRWTYTDEGRKLTQTDPYTGTAMPSPQAPVNPGTVYAPTTWTYDSTGQLIGTGLPETLTYAVYHDDEGNMLNTSVAGPNSFVAGTRYWITTRGESFQQDKYPIATVNDYASRPANGALVPGVTPIRLLPSEGSVAIFEPINALVVGRSLTARTKDPDQNYISCGPLNDIDRYDAASRLVARPTDSLNVSDCSTEPGDPLTWSYDAESHTIAQGTVTAQWGPTGKPYRISLGAGTSDSLHYDGDNLLFVTDASGRLRDLKVGAIADIAGGTQLTIIDRDNANMLVSGHSNALYYGATFGDRKFGPYRGSEGPGSIQPPQYSPIIFKGSVSAPTCQVNACTPLAGGVYPYSRLEGFAWGTITIQGVRAVDDSSGQWTTPDAYAGDVHDPMSQKAFMWDGNNAYQYADPSGYLVKYVGTEDQKSAAAAAYQSAIDYFMGGGDKQSAALLDNLRTAPSFTVNVSVTGSGSGLDNSGIDKTGQVYVNWDSREGLQVVGGTQSAALGLLHEADHARRAATDAAGYALDLATKDNAYTDNEEKRVIEGSEGAAATRMHEPLRHDHFGTPCKTASVSSRTCL